MVYVKLKTNTFVSKIAFRLIRSYKNKAVASTIGTTIHLHNITPEDFIEKKAFLRHELQHVIQYQTIRFFALKYIWETLKKGYFKNKYEVEACEKAIYPFPSQHVVYGDDFVCVKETDMKIGVLKTIIARIGFDKYPKVILR